MVPLENISEMMRALGHYPTNKEIENMMNEVKYSQYLETGTYVTELNLNAFVKYLSLSQGFSSTTDLFMELLKAKLKRL